MSNQAIGQDHEQSRRWGILFIILPILGVLCLTLLLFFQGRSHSTTSEFIPVNLHSQLEADYLANPNSILILGVRLDLIWDTLYDREPEATDLEDRQATLLNGLLTPVPTVTPSLSTCQGIHFIYADQDTWIESANPTATHGSETLLQIGHDGDNTKRLLLHFPLEAIIPQNTLIHSARLEMDVEQTVGTASPESLVFFNLTSPFGEINTNWSNQPESNVQYEASELALGSIHVWDVTDIVRNWLESHSENEGIVIESQAPIDFTFVYYGREIISQINSKPNSVAIPVGPRLVINCGGELPQAVAINLNTPTPTVTSSQPTPTRELAKPTTTSTPLPTPVLPSPTLAPPLPSPAVPLPTPTLPRPLPTSTQAPPTPTLPPPTNTPSPPSGDDDDDDGGGAPPPASPVRADLALSVTDSSDPVIAGNNFTYTLTITNNGPNNATNVTVTDALPPGVSLISATVGQGTGCSGTSTVSCNLGPIANGTSAIVIIVVTVNSSISGVLTTSAMVSASENDPTPGNNSATETTLVTSAVDLMLTKTDSADPIVAGDSLTYTLTISNIGPSDATVVTVTDTLPISTVFVSASTGCTQSGGMITCGLGNLTAGSSRQIIVGVTVNPAVADGTVINNTATVSGAETDPLPGNNTATEPTTINKVADLAINKAGTPNPVIAGQTLTYTLTITNMGPSNASGVTLTDTLPAGITFASASAGCANAGGVVTCNIGNLSVGASVQRTIVVTVNASTTTDQVNTATIGGNETDPTSGNNSDTITTTIQTETDLAISKADTPDPVTAGQTLTYTLTITNMGPSNATAVILTDTLSAGVTFASASAGCANSGGIVTCAIGGLTAGSSLQRTIVVTVNASTTTNQANTVTIAGNETDPNGGNNSDTTLTTVQTETDLIISKTDNPDPVIAGQPLTYTLTITNIGPSNATGVVLTDTLPAGVTFASASAGCANAGGIVTCTIGGLSAGVSVQRTIVVTVNASTVANQSNTVAIGGNESDPNGGNNSDTITTTVQTETDLAISKADSPDPVIAGQALTYTLSITNIGPSNATGVVLTDTLPAGVTFASASVGCANAGGVVTCTIGSLTAGSSLQRTIVVTINSGTTGSLSNSATVGGNETDPNSGNNSDTIITIVQTETDLIISKADTPDPVVAGQLLTYTLTIINMGPSNASGVILTDTLSAGVTFASASAGCANASGTVNCTIGGLVVGSSLQRTIVVTVNASTTANQSNTVTIGGNETDPTPGNNSDTITTTIQTETDLLISKTDTPDPVIAGQLLTYTLTLTNAGPSNATGVVLTDTLPAGVTFASASAGCANAGGTVTCTIGGLAVGGSLQRTIVVTVDASTTTDQVNTVTIGGNETDPIPSNNSDTLTTTVEIKADLAISKADSPDPVVAGQPLTYTLTITNIGPSNATAVILTDTLSAGVTFASASAGCANAGGIVTCTIGGLSAGVSVQRTIVVTVNASTVANQSNTVAIGGNESDPNGGNNSDTITTTVQTETDLAISKADSPDPVIAGQALTYTLSITNIGPSNATGVVLTDTLPAGVTFASASVGCANAGGVVTCTIGSLTAGSSLQRTIVVTINSGTTGSLSNSATVGGNETDPNSGNNSDTIITIVQTETDLIISKTDTPDPVVAGQLLTYTLTITNLGLSNATGVVLTDTLPAGITFASASAGCANISGTVTCTIGGLALGSSVQRTIVVTINSGSTGLLTNSAIVGSNETDPTPANNSDTITTTIQIEADLTINKTGTPNPVVAGQLLTYTLTITNNGPSNAQSVVVTDTLPTSVTVTGTSPATSTQNGQNLGWNLGTLANGASQTIVVTVAVDGNLSDVLTNTATITSTTIDPGPAVNTVTITTTVLGSADLQISKHDSSDPVLIGQPITYTLLITNAGPATATGVMVTDTLPASVVFSSATASQGPGCNQAGGIVTCALGTITPTGTPLVQSTFDSSAEGWTIFDNGASTTPDYNVAGGNPGGYISDVDGTAGDYYFVAPAIFWGNQAAAYLGSLEFDLQRTAGATYIVNADVILSGGGITVTTQISSPSPAWTYYTLALNESIWINTSTVNPATQQEMLTVLSNLDTLRIRGDFVTGVGDIGALDNVVLTSGPVRATIVISSTGEGSLTNGANVTANEPDPNLANNTASENTTVLPGLSISDVSVTEGDSGTTAAVFTVTLSVSSTQVVTVTYTTAEGTARSDNFDYNAITNTLTFPPGTIVQTLTVLVNGDILEEADEIFFVTLSNPINATLTANDQGAGTILNDDNDSSAITICSLPTKDAYFHQDAPDHNHSNDNHLKVKPDVGKEHHIVMEFNLASIPVGSNVLTSTLFLYEEDTQNNQTIHLHRITNSWVESQVSWNERNAGVPWNTPGGDYITATTVATFTPNIDKQHRQINITSVTQSWVNGTFTNYGLLLRSTGDNGEVKFKSKEEGNSSKQPKLCVTYTLPQADLAVTKTVNNSTPNETNTIAFTVTVTNNGPASATGVVISDTLPSGLTYLSNTPSQGIYTNTTGVWSMGSLAASTSATLIITTTVNTGTLGTTITNTVTISSLDQIDPLPANNTASVVITPTLPALSINDIAVTEGNSGTTSAVFTITLSTASALTVTTNYSTSDGTATTADNDYLPISGILTFTPGIITQFISVTVVGDVITESTETFTVTLSSPTNATIADGEGIGTISQDIGGFALPPPESNRIFLPLIMKPDQDNISPD